MPKLFYLLSLAWLCCAASAAQPASTPPPAPTTQPDLSMERPLSALPYTPGLDIRGMDPLANPCIDFYQYSCGGWIQRNPIPDDQARWSVYGKLFQDNQRFLWGILEKLTKHTKSNSASQQQLGDYFAACMDETAIEKLGTQPLTILMGQIESMQSKQDLPQVLARLHLATGSDGLFFGFGSDQDYSDSTQVIAFASSGGLGLPDRAHYIKDDESSKATRQQYLTHVQRMFELLGDKPELAQHEASIVLTVETSLAQSSLTRVERRDPHLQFHKMDVAALQELTPGFDWKSYFKAMRLPKLTNVNVTQPVFYKALEQQWQTLSLEDIKTYLRWHIAHTAAPYLSSAFVNEDFAFFRQTLRGVPKIEPRWQRCVKLIDEQLGDALGREFVNRTFGPKLKQKTLQMAKQIESAMQTVLKESTWMSSQTQQQALLKLHAVVNKVGYPDKWRDYRSVKIHRQQFFGNVERATRFEISRQLAKIGKPVNRNEWGMSPPTVNAYYSAQMNDINFPAGILQPPLYDPKMDDAPNFGNTGSTIGHELTHGFDDEGRKFDAQGNLKNWWMDADAAAFTERTQCLVNQYAQYTVVDDIKINSKLTLGEDVADLGGLTLAWAAWKAHTQNAKLPHRDGLSPEQRFFVGYAQWACESSRPEELRLNAMTDEHSPGKYRVNGLMINMPQFEQAFACKPTDPMVSPKRCKVW